jgi:hypothetical protein
MSWHLRPEALDVRAGSDPAGGWIRVPAYRDCLHQKPTVRTVALANAKFDFVPRARGDGMCPARHYRGAVVRMNDTQPAISPRVVESGPAVLVHFMKILAKSHRYTLWCTKPTAAMADCVASESRGMPAAL